MMKTIEFSVTEQAILQEIMTQDMGLNIISLTVEKRAKLLMSDVSQFNETRRALCNAPIDNNGWTLLHYATKYTEIG